MATIKNIPTAMTAIEMISNLMRAALSIFAFPRPLLPFFFTVDELRFFVPVPPLRLFFRATILVSNPTEN